jgi:tryptophan synthase alpha chain
MMVGFGVSSAEDVRIISPYADGVIVGSALIKLIGKNYNNDYITSVGEFVRELRRGLV